MNMSPLPLEATSAQPLSCLTYPKEEGDFWKKWKGGNCRRGYGLEYIEKTGQNRCAYCGLDFSKCFENWLTMVLDHVIPVKVCKELGIKGVEWAWCNSLANAALACAACNGFCNRYKLPSKIPSDHPADFQEFLKRRDLIFLDRKEKIQCRRNEEKEEFKRIFPQGN